MSRAPAWHHPGNLNLQTASQLALLVSQTKWPAARAVRTSAGCEAAESVAVQQHLMPGVSLTPAACSSCFSDSARKVDRRCHLLPPLPCRWHHFDRLVGDCKCPALVDHTGHCWALRGATQFAVSVVSASRGLGRTVRACSSSSGAGCCVPANARLTPSTISGPRCQQHSCVCHQR